MPAESILNEEIWAEAKRKASRQKTDDIFALTSHIYQQMGGKYRKKKEVKKAEPIRETLAYRMLEDLEKAKRRREGESWTQPSGRRVKKVSGKIVPIKPTGTDKKEKPDDGEKTVLQPADKQKKDYDKVSDILAAKFGDGSDAHLSHKFERKGENFIQTVNIGGGKFSIALSGKDALLGKTTFNKLSVSNDWGKTWQPAGKKEPVKSEHQAGAEKLGNRWMPSIDGNTISLYLKTKKDALDHANRQIALKEKFSKITGTPSGLNENVWNESMKFARDRKKRGGQEDAFKPVQQLAAEAYRYSHHRAHATGSSYGSAVPIDRSARSDWEDLTGKPIESETEQKEHWNKISELFRTGKVEKASNTAAYEILNNLINRKAV